MKGRKLQSFLIIIGISIMMLTLITWEMLVE